MVLLSRKCIVLKPVEQFNRGSIIVCALCYKSVCKVLLKTKVQCVRYNLIFRSFAQKKEDKIYVFAQKDKFRGMW